MFICVFDSIAYHCYQQIWVTDKQIIYYLSNTTPFLYFATLYQNKEK